MVIKKSTGWKALLTSMHFMRNHEFYFRIILGDKDTVFIYFNISIDWRGNLQIHLII